MLGQVGAKLRRYAGKDGWTGSGYCHWCPACKVMHAFAVEQPFSNGAKWSFDGNVDNPTFAPSMNIRIGPMPLGHSKAGQFDVCHYFLNAGILKFCTDSTHEFRGRDVPLPDLPVYHRD